MVNLRNKTVIIFFIFSFLFHNSPCQEIETMNRYRRNKLADEYYDKALHYYEKDLIPEAIEFFETSVSLDPKYYLSYYFLGLSYEKAGDIEKALLNYNLSIALKSDFPEGLFNRAILYYRTGHYEKAITDFNYLLELPESETQAIYFRGVKFGENDKDTGFDQILTMSTRKTDIHRFLGQCYTKLNQPDSSILHYTVAIQLSPDQDNLHVNRGMVYMEWGKLDSAKHDFQNALEINPQNSLARYNMALLDGKNEIESLDQINALIKKNPNLPFAYASRAYYYYQDRQYQLAINDYDSAILLEPENQTHYLNRGMCEEKMNHLENALENYRTAAQLNPDHPKVWYNLGNIFYKQENYKQAIESYTMSIQLQPGVATYYYNRGLSYFQIEDRFNACKDMQMASQLHMEQAERFLMRNCH